MSYNCPRKGENIPSTPHLISHPFVPIQLYDDTKAGVTDPDLFQCEEKGINARPIPQCDL